jgi:lincosamide nucleotidyltransferase A/C/D/E
VISEQDALGLYRALDGAGLRVWVDGGWSVDALLGRQLRDHNDLELALDDRDWRGFLALVASLGFARIREDGLFTTIFGDPDGRQLDVHRFIRDASGAVTGGILYPTESLTGTGVIAGAEVRCIAATSMVEFLTPYLEKHAWKYVPAVTALCERYAIAKPPELAAAAARLQEPGDAST